MKKSRKVELVTYLEELGRQFAHAAEVVPELFSEKENSFQEQLAVVIEETNDKDLFVPLIGGFSTGKSTALNSLIGRDILPEKVSPETAIPAELHFDINERLMALSANNEWFEYNVSELANLSSKAEQYQVVKIYLNCPVLEEIQPLVLVDMPGFDSGLDQHNAAILRYITTGALYLFMVNAKAGTVNRQDVRRLEEILDLGRSLEVFLTMTDLASPDELKETLQYVSEHIEMITGDSTIGKINKDDVAALLSEVKSADVSALFDGMALPKIQDLYFEAHGQVNTAIKALGSNTETIKQTIHDAELSLKAVESERERLLTDMRDGGISSKCDLVIRKLENVLNRSAEELVVQAKLGESALKNAVSDLVRSTLSVEIQALVRKSTKDIVYQFSGEINLNNFSPSSEGGDWANNLISVIETETMNALSGVFTKAKNGSGTGPLAALAIMIPHPVFRIIFSILPGIIGKVFSIFKSKNENNEYREAIVSRVIPTIISQVRPQVLDSLTSSEQEIIRVVSEQVERKVNNQKAVYNEITTRSEPEIQALREHQEALNDIRQMMTKRAQGVIA